MSNVEGSSLLRAGVLGLVILGVLGVASGALPVRCMLSGSCGAAKTETAAATPAAESQLSPTATKSNPAPQQVAVAAQEPAPTKTQPSLTNNDVLAGTFGQLDPKIQTPALKSQPAAPVQQVAVAKPEPAAPGELKTVKVRTISINPDGTPILPRPLSATDSVAPQGYAEEPAQPPAAQAAEEITQVANADELAPTPAPRPAKTTPSAPSSTSKSATAMSIAGSGANVRSSPGKGGSKVLFVLAAGEKVKVGDRQRGWVKITDDQGRSGWVYQDYLVKG
jgi:hypothetical protein